MVDAVEGPSRSTCGASGAGRTVTVTGTSTVSVPSNTVSTKLTGPTVPGSGVKVHVPSGRIETVPPGGCARTPGVSGSPSGSLIVSTPETGVPAVVVSSSVEPEGASLTGVTSTGTVTTLVPP